MIRILHVVPNMHRAGLETFIMNVYRKIDKSQIQFDFLMHYTKKFDYDEEIEKMGGIIYRLSIREDNNFFKYIKDLKKFFIQHPEYKIIHGHMESFGFIYSKIAKESGVKYIIAHSHNAFVEPGIKGFLKSLMNKPWRNYANVLLACSNKAGKYMFGKKSFEVIENGIDIKKFAYNEKIREQYRLEFDLVNKTVIGHIGRFEKQKNHNFLIKIFNEYLKINNNSILILVGTGKYFDMIQKKVKKMGIEKKVLFLGVRKDLCELYQMFDIFLLPSLFEGLPVVGVEAQAASLPMIVSDTVTEELDITNNVKRMSLKKSPTDWAKKIVETMNEFHRTDVSTNLISAGYDILSTVNKLEKMYKGFNEKL